MNWLIKEASKNLNVKFKGTCTGYTPSAVNWAKEAKIAAGAKSGGGHVSMDDIDIGDWGYIYSSSRNSARHVFLIVEKRVDSVVTIEGNTNSGGGAEGFGVFKRVRPINQVWAVVKWYNLYKL